MFTINAEKYIWVNREKYLQHLQRYQADPEDFLFKTLANESLSVTHLNFNKIQSF